MVHKFQTQYRDDSPILVKSPGPVSEFGATCKFSRFGLFTWPNVSAISGRTAESNYIDTEVADLRKPHKSTRIFIHNCDILRYCNLSNNILDGTSRPRIWFGRIARSGRNNGHSLDTIIAQKPSSDARLSADANPTATLPAQQQQTGTSGCARGEQPGSRRLRRGDGLKGESTHRSGRAESSTGYARCGVRLDWSQLKLPPYAHVLLAASGAWLWGSGSSPPQFAPALPAAPAA